MAGLGRDVEDCVAAGRRVEHRPLVAEIALAHLDTQSRQRRRRRSLQRNHFMPLRTQRAADPAAEEAGAAGD